MMKKIFKTPFIFFLISAVLFIVSFVFFQLFNHDIRVSANFLYFEIIYVVSISSFYFHFYPGLIFLCISSVLALIGTIQFIIGFFYENKPNKKQNRTNGLDRKNLILKISLVIFVITIILSIIAIVNLIIFIGITPNPVAITGFSSESSRAITITGLNNHYYPAVIILMITLILSIIGLILYSAGIWLKKKSNNRNITQ